MKKVLFVTLLTLVICLSITPIFAGAETSEEPLAEKVETSTTNEEQEESITDFFNNKIMPFLVSSGTTLLGYAVMLVPMLKKSSQYKALQAYCSGVVENNKQLQEVVSLIDIDAIKDKVQTAVGECLEKAVKELRLDGQVYAELMSKMELLSAQVQSLILGATNAWASSPAAVNHLTDAPTASVVVQLEKEVYALKEALRAIKGEEAEAIIASATSGV